jgi:Intracellular proteinase inhibitor
MRAQDLVYARLSGVTVLNASGIGFGLSTGDGYARLSLNNNTREPMRVIFGSGQTFDLVITDANGKTVYRWSEGKAFTQALRPGVFPPGETSWVVPLPPPAEALSRPLTIEGSLLTIGGPFKASVTQNLP